MDLIRLLPQHGGGNLSHLGVDRGDLVGDLAQAAEPFSIAVGLPRLQRHGRAHDQLSDLWKQNDVELIQAFLADFLRKSPSRMGFFEYPLAVEVRPKEFSRLSCEG